MMQLDEDHIVGTHFKEIWPRELWPLIDEKIEEVLQGNNCSFDTYRLNGSEVGWWNVKMTPLINDQGKINQFIAISSDITDRINSENKLKDNEYFLNSVIENIPSMIFVKDAEDLRFVRFNRAGEKLIGYSRETLLGKNDFDLFPEEEALFFTTKDKEVLQTKKMSDIKEESILTKDKGIRILHTKKIPILDDKGLPIFLLGISEDITDKKNAELEKKKNSERLIQSQKMESIGTLAAGIAHDFNNILSAVIGYAELGKMFAAQDNTVSEYFSEIYNAGQRASKLIKQILAFSRQGEQEFFQIQIQSIIKEVIKLLKATIPANIEIQQNIAPECENIFIMSDQTQMHQVVMNLCTNAHHSMKETGGILEVSLAKIKLKEGDPILTKISLSPGNYLELSVRDNGPGIDPAIINQIFEPYFTTKKRGEGTGMGLAVVHGIIQSHHGAINVQSVLGEGTKFQIFFPIVKSTDNSSEQETIFHVTGGSERILIVDDEEPILRVTKGALTNLGYDVTSVSKSPEAYKIFQEDPNAFDLIITDMAMPSMSGAELAQNMIKISPNIPIIMCTGYSEVMNRQRALSLGIKEFIMKPVLLSELAQIIRKVLDQ